MSVNVDLNGNQKETPKYIIIGCPDDKKALLLAKLAVEETVVHFIDKESELTILPISNTPKLTGMSLYCEPFEPDLIEVSKDNNVPFWRNLPSKKGKKRK